MKLKIVSRAIEETTDRRWLVKTFSDGSIIKTPIIKEHIKKKPRFPYPKFSMDKTRKKSF